MSDQELEEKDLNLIDILIIFAKRKRLILGGTLGVALITVVIVLILPPIYVATTKIMPPQQSSSSTAAQLLGSLGGAATAILGGGTTTSGDVYVGLLQSQGILYPIIDQFDLKKLYKVTTHEEASRIILEDTLKVEVDSKSGIITVSVEDKDPERAANMANAFIEELRKLLDRIAVTDSGKRRIFFEDQLKKAHEKLTRSEDEIKKFQENTGAISIENQTSAVIQGIAGLMAQIAAREVQIKVMKGYATENNPDLIKAQQELNALKEQLKDLQEKQESQSQSVFIPTGQIPALGTEYLRKMREFKYNEALFELLAKQYEAAKLDEAKEAAVIQVIYEATPPEKNAKPKKTLIVILATVAASIVFVMIAFLMELIQISSQKPDNQGRIKELKMYLKKL